MDVVFSVLVGEFALLFVYRFLHPAYLHTKCFGVAQLVNCASLGNKGLPVTRRFCIEVPLY